MANLSESISKGSPFNMIYGVKTTRHSFISLNVKGKPFYNDDLLAQKNPLLSIHSHMQNQTTHSPTLSCRGIVLVGTPMIEQPPSPHERESSPTITPLNVNDDKSNNSLWERRKAKAQRDQDITSAQSPPNLSVATTFPYTEASSDPTSSVGSAVSDINSAYPPLPLSASSVSSSMSNALPPATASPVSSVYSYEGTNFGNISPTIVQAARFINLDNSSSTSLVSAASSAGSSESVSPTTTTNFVQTFQPYEPELTQYNSNYWNFSDPEIRDKPQADYTLLPQMFPQAVAQPPQPPQQPLQEPPQISPYTVPSTFYLDTSKLHSAGPGQPIVPEVYDMNAMHRLNMIGQQPLPTPGLAYPAAFHPHSAPTTFGYKPNELINPLAASVAGGYFMGAPQGPMGMRPAMRGGKRKSRYGGMGMGMGGLQGGYSGHICAECHVVESPEWRKGPKGPKTLCNACGLRWAKKSRKESQKNKAVTAAAAAAVATSKNTGPGTSADALVSSGST